MTIGTAHGILADVVAAAAVQHRDGAAPTPSEAAALLQHVSPMAGPAVNAALRVVAAHEAPAAPPLRMVDCVFVEAPAAEEAAPGGESVRSTFEVIPGGDFDPGEWVDPRDGLEGWASLLELERAEGLGGPAAAALGDEFDVPDLSTPAALLALARV